MNDTLPCLLCPPLLSSLLLSSPLFSAQLNDTLSLICLFFTTFFSLICLDRNTPRSSDLTCLLCPPLLSSLLLSSPLFSAQLNDTLSLICLFFTTFFSLICLFFTLSMHE